MSEKPNLPLGEIAGYDQGQLKKTEVADKSGVSAHDKLLATVAGGQVNLKVTIAESPFVVQARCSLVTLLKWKICTTVFWVLFCNKCMLFFSTPPFSFHSDRLFLGMSFSFLFPRFVK